MADTEGQPEGSQTSQPQELDLSSRESINNYIKTRVNEYQSGDLVNLDLWEQFREDFADFTQDNLRTANQYNVRNLRSALRNKGVYIAREPRVTTSAALHRTLQEEERTEWTEEAIRAHVTEYGPFSSYQLNRRASLLPGLVAKDNSITTPLANPRSPTEPLNQPSIEPQNQSPLRPQLSQGTGLLTDPIRLGTSPFTDRNATRTPAIDLSKELYNIERFYKDEDKYKGEEDVFDHKLSIFKAYCNRVKITGQGLIQAYSAMLTGDARNHYFTNISNNLEGRTFEEITNATRNYFEGPEHAQKIQTEWNTASLQHLADNNPGKSLLDCFRTLVSDLRRLQLGFDPSLRTDQYLRQKLIMACQEMEACRFACSKPANTSMGLVNDLRSSILAYEASHPQTVTQALVNNHTTQETFFTDRRYHKKSNFKPTSVRNTINVRPQRTTGQPSSIYNRNGANKKCFVCKQPGCWSTKHTQEERDQSKKRFQDRLNQFITDYEGCESEDISDEAIETLIVDYDSEDLYGDQPDCQETFITTFGPVTDDQAFQTATLLADRALAYGISPVNSPLLSIQPITDQRTLPQRHFQENDPFTYLATERYTSKEFYGIMIDTGASSKSTVGYGQFLAYKEVASDADIDTTQAGAVTVQFGIGSTASIGIISVNTPIGNVDFHVVKADTPFLLCLADMDNLRVYYNNVTDTLITPSATLPIVRRFGHPFLIWGKTLTVYIQHTLDCNPCYLTDTEINQLHRRFGHPSANKLYKVLERSGHDINKQTLDQLTKYCSFCQKYGRSPGRFKFTLRKDLDFNQSVYVDITYINGKPVLHIIDEATRYQAARWLSDISAKHTWDTLRTCWIDTYLGPPGYIIYDSGTTFVSKEFNNYATSMAISTKAVPVEAHWSIGLVEEAHGPLKRAYQIITEECPDIKKELALQMAVKAVNDTAGPDGLVPTLLVYGAYPRMSFTDPPAPSVTQRADAIKKAMAELVKLRAKRAVNNALNRRNGPVTEPVHSLPINSEVLVWREPGKWTGPYRLLSVEGETCRVLQENGIKSFRTTVVKPYYRTEEPFEDIQPRSLSKPPERRLPGRPRKLPPTEAILVAKDNPEPPQEVRKSRRKRTSKKHSIFNVTDQPDPQIGPQTDLQTNPADISICIMDELPFSESRRKEVNGLLERGVFEVIKEKDIPPNTRIFSARFVDEIKNLGTDKAFEKSRLVIQAYNDQGKSLVLTQSPTIQRVSQRIILALAPSLQSERAAKLYLRDISQAYTQSNTSLSRIIIIRAPTELGLPRGTFLRVIKPLYGVPEAGNHWFNTYHQHHLSKLDMNQSTFDPCLLYTPPKVDSTNKSGFGIVGLQTDDTLFLANQAFADLEELKLKEAKFQAKPREQLTCQSPIRFNGGLIKQEEDGKVKLTQERQARNLRLISTQLTDLTSSRGEVRRAVNTQDQYVAQRARGAYIATVCQPESAYDLSFAAQVINPQKADIKQLNKRIQWQMNNPARGLTFVPLDLSSLNLTVFTDASFANNQDLSSQIGFVIVLTDRKQAANIIHWSSVKCKRVTRSVLASELYALALGFDIAAAIKSTIQGILHLQHLPLVLCTDSKSLYDCLVKLGTTQEKRLMIDLMCLRQSYERREITEIKWIKGEDNPADAMTKSKPCQALRTLIDTNTLDLQPTEWVERN